jgi:acetyltransferase-like isoleucine patch superfamily enzyme
MPAFLVRVNDSVSPFGTPARDAWLLDTTLGAAAERTLRRAGLEPVHVDSLEEAEARARESARGAIVTLDSVAFSPQLLRDFLRAAARTSGDTALRCAVPPNAATDLLAHVTGLERVESKGGGGEVWTAPMYFLRGKASLASASVHVVPHKPSLVRLPVPKGFLGGAPELVVGVSESFLCNVSHWVHILRLNATAIVVPWNERRRVGMSILGIAWYLWRLLLSFPFVGGRILESFRMVDRKARVHHSAHIEGSVIRKGVDIGVGAVIKYSYIGEGAHIEDGAHVVGAVIGPGAFVSRQSVVVSSVLYPGSFAGQQLMQFSILGPDAIVLAMSNFFDLNLDRNIRVAHGTSVVDSGSRMLGACIGPRARIGGGVWVASGREIPADAFIVKDPAEVAFRIGDVGTAAAIVRGGTAQPLGGRPLAGGKVSEGES